MRSEATLYSGTTAASGTNTDTAIPLGIVEGKIVRVKIKRVAGAAATFTPAIFSASGASLADITQEFLGSNTAVAALFDSTNIEGYVAPAAGGTIYFRPGPQGGSVDNTFAYQIWVEPIQ